MSSVPDSSSSASSEISEFPGGPEDRSASRPDDDSSSAPTARIFTKGPIVAASMLGGALGGGYLLWSNFKAFGDDAKARATMVYMLGGTLVLLGTLFFLPPAIVDAIPDLVIVGAIVGACLGAYGQYQEEMVTRAVENGAETGSIWRGIGIGVLALVPTVAMMVPFLVGVVVLETAGLSVGESQGFGFVEGIAQVEQGAPFEGRRITMNDTGNDVFYDPPVTPDEARTVGTYLESISYFTAENTRNARVTKEEAGYVVSLPVQDGTSERLMQPPAIDATLIDLKRWLDGPVVVETLGMEDGRQIAKERRWTSDDFD